MTVSDRDKTGIRSILPVWVALVLVLNAVRWLGGFPSGMLAFDQPEEQAKDDFIMNLPSLARQACEPFPPSRAPLEKPGRRPARSAPVRLFVDLHHGGRCSRCWGS